MSTSGGRGEIRTHGRFHVGGFQDRWIKPLSHSSFVLVPMEGLEPPLSRTGT